MAVGDALRITKNFRVGTSRFKNNELCTVTAIDRESITVGGGGVIKRSGPLHLDQGAAVTSHAVINSRKSTANSASAPQLHPNLIRKARDLFETISASSRYQVRRSYFSQRTPLALMRCGQCSLGTTQ